MSVHGGGSRLAVSMGGPTVKRSVDDDAWKLLAADAKLIDYTAARSC